eukprot:scaffold207_cov409-Prasinococcus_capsulatus_cf.AAC.138
MRSSWSNGHHLRCSSEGERDTLTLASRSAGWQACYCCTGADGSLRCQALKVLWSNDQSHQAGDAQRGEVLAFRVAGVQNVTWRSPYAGARRVSQRGKWAHHILFHGLVPAWYTMTGRRLTALADCLTTSSRLPDWVTAPEQECVSRMPPSLTSCIAIMFSLRYFRNDLSSICGPAMATVMHKSNITSTCACTLWLGHNLGGSSTTMSKLL